MVHFKALDVRWIWRYRLFYLAGIAIMSLQIFLAVIFFTLYEETDRNADDSYRNVLLSDQEPELKSRESIDILEKNVINKEINQNSKYVRIKGGAILVQHTKSEYFGLSTVCNVSGREPISAINRAKSSYCKQLILNTTCLLRNSQLYPVTLPHSCPANDLTAGKHLGCFRDNNSVRLLNRAYYNSSKLNSQSHCTNKCLQGGFSYAGVQFADECFCGDDEPPNTALLPDSFCNIRCPSNLSQTCGGYFTMNVLETGVAKFSAQIANDAATCTNDCSTPPVRIVFLLTLNGRSIRQVYRLIKILFHRDHFFFIHVDARQDFMFRELLSLELKLSNVRLSRRRYSTIWGGASLLTMLLQSMSELIQSSWDWDFLINLSESDFPIKNNTELVAFLTANRNRNFVKSHGRDVQHFIHKQGLDKTFVECDEHMWRIGNKILPTGIVIDGGSDWIALSRPFINYVVTAQNDHLLDGLKIVFKHTLLPAESFFHTVLRNSMFCDTYIDNNLHVTNWKRHLGCKCQYKHVVDWCGCSPNVFTTDDWYRIQSTVNKPLFFARKFDPTVSQSVINKVEELLYGRYSDDFKSEKKYWQNVYHHQDRNPVVDDAVITVSSSLSRNMLKFLTKNDLMCSNLEFNKLLQVHSFYESDSQKGILVNFGGVSSKNFSVQFEVWHEIKRPFTLHNSSQVASRFIHLMVNTNFDQKEKMSRNYVAAIGPSSEPVLIYQTVAGLAVSNITVVWFDPTQMVADIDEIALDEVPGIYHLKSNLRVPLIPGEWEIYLIHDVHVIAEIPFVVTPLVQEHVSSPSGVMEQTKEPVDLNYLLPVIKLKKHGYNPEKRKEESLMRTSYTGSKRIDWIDSLTSKSYRQVDFCIVKNVNIDRTSTCYQQNFQHCDTLFWSSFSPDPKIHITAVNKLTGRLN